MGGTVAAAGAGFTRAQLAPHKRESKARAVVADAVLNVNPPSHSSSRRRLWCSGRRRPACMGEAGPRTGGPPGTDHSELDLKPNKRALLSGFHCKAMLVFRLC